MANGNQKPMEMAELIEWLQNEQKKTYQKAETLKGKEKHVELGRWSAYLSVLEKIRPIVTE